MKRIIKSIKKGCTYIRFFAGSASTVEAVLQLNRKMVVKENMLFVRIIQNLLKQILLTTNVYRELKM